MEFNNPSRNLDEMNDLNLSREVAKVDDDTSTREMENEVSSEEIYIDYEVINKEPLCDKFDSEMSLSKEIETSEKIICDEIVINNQQVEIDEFSSEVVPFDSEHTFEEVITDDNNILLQNMEISSGILSENVEANIDSEILSEKVETDIMVSYGEVRIDNEVISRKDENNHEVLFKEIDTDKISFDEILINDQVSSQKIQEDKILTEGLLIHDKDISEKGMIVKENSLGKMEANDENFSKETETDIKITPEKVEDRISSEEIENSNTLLSKEAEFDDKFSLENIELDKKILLKENMINCEGSYVDVIDNIASEKVKTDDNFSSEEVESNDKILSENLTSNIKISAEEMDIDSRLSSQVVKTDGVALIEKFEVDSKILSEKVSLEEVPNSKISSEKNEIDDVSSLSLSNVENQEVISEKMEIDTKVLPEQVGNDKGLSEQIKKTASTTQKKPLKTSENKYPGLRFVLFVKSLPGSGKQESWFECILCSPHTKMVPKEMVAHMRSPSHLNNLMKWECPHLLDMFSEQYKPQEIAKFILKFEASNLPDQSMVAANPTNVELKRSEVEALVKSLQNSLRTSVPTEEKISKDEKAPDEAGEKSVDIANQANDGGNNLENQRNNGKDDKNRSWEGDKISSKASSTKRRSRKYWKKLNRKMKSNFEEFPLNVSKLDFSEEKFPFCSRGFQGKLFIMEALKNIRLKSEEDLKFGPCHPYRQFIEQSLSKIFDFENCDKKIYKEEFEKIDVWKIDILQGCLFYKGKPILIMSEAATIAQKYHIALRHPTADVLCKIIAMEFMVFSNLISEIVTLTENCLICKAIPEEFSKAHSSKVLDAYLEWPERRSSKVLQLCSESILSFGRNPTKLVIICDDRNADLVNLEINNVSVHVCSGLKLRDAFEFISKYRTFNQESTLYLVLLGIHSLFNWDTRSICENLTCQEPLKLPIGMTQASVQLAFRQLVHEAINLHRCFMIHSRKDDMIFGEILPVDLRSYFAYVVRTHTNLYGGKDTHKWTEPSHLQCKYFNQALEKYNAWTKAFNKYLGYSACSLVNALDKNYSIVDGKLQSENMRFLSNGYIPNKSTQEAKFQYQEKFCRKIFDQIKKREKDVFNRNHASLRHPLMSTAKCNPTIMDKVVIFTDKKNFLPMTEYFKSSNVMVTSGNKTKASLQSMKRMLGFNSKIMFIITLSVDQCFLSRFYKDCIKEICEVKVSYHYGKPSLFTLNKTPEQIVNTILNDTNRSIALVKEVFGESCFLVLIPPFPFCLFEGGTLENPAFDHDLLHSFRNLNAVHYFTTLDFIKKLSPIYLNMIERSVELTKIHFGNSKFYPTMLDNLVMPLHSLFRFPSKLSVPYRQLPLYWRQMVIDLVSVAFTGISPVPPLIPDTTSLISTSLSLPFTEKNYKLASDSRFVRVVILHSPSLSSALKYLRCHFIHFIEVDLTTDISGNSKRLTYLKSFHSPTLFIYVSDFSFITESCFLTDLCSGASCLKSLPCFVLKKSADIPAVEMAQNIALNLYSNLYKLAEVLPGAFIVAPLAPFRALSPSLLNARTHSTLHDYLSNGRSFKYLWGPEEDWLAAFEVYRNTWTYVMEAFKPDVGLPYKILLDYELWKVHSVDMLSEVPSDDDAWDAWLAWKNTLGKFIYFCFNIKKDGKFNYNLDLKAKTVVEFNTEGEIQKSKALSSSEEISLSNSSKFDSYAPSKQDSIGNSLPSNPYQAQSDSSAINKGIPPPVHGRTLLPNPQYPQDPRFSHGPWFPQNSPFPPPPRFPHGRPFLRGSHFQQGLPGSQGPPFTQCPPFPKESSQPSPAQQGHFPPCSFPKGSPHFASTSQAAHPSSNTELTFSKARAKTEFSYNFSYASNISSQSYDSNKKGNSVTPSRGTSEAVISKKPVLYSKTSTDISKTSTDISKTSTAISKTSTDISKISTAISNDPKKPPGKILPQKKEEKVKESKEAIQSFRVLVGKINRKYTNEDIESLLSVIDGFINFDRPKVQHISCGVAKFDNQESAMRCVRLLDKYPLRFGPIEVRCLDTTPDGDTSEKLDDESVLAADNEYRSKMKKVVEELKLHVVQADQRISQILNISLPVKQIEESSGDKKVIEQRPNSKDNKDNDLILVDAYPQVQVNSQDTKRKDVSPIQAKNLSSYLKKKKKEESSVSDKTFNKKRENLRRKSPDYRKFEGEAKGAHGKRLKKRSLSRSKSRTPDRLRSRCKSRSPRSKRYRYEHRNKYHWKSRPYPRKELSKSRSRRSRSRSRGPNLRSRSRSKGPKQKSRSKSKGPKQKSRSRSPFKSNFSSRFRFNEQQKSQRPIKKSKSRSPSIISVDSKSRSRSRSRSRSKSKFVSHFRRESTEKQEPYFGDPLYPSEFYDPRFWDSQGPPRFPFPGPLRPGQPFAHFPHPRFDPKLPYRLPGQECLRPEVGPKRPMCEIHITNIPHLISVKFLNDVVMASGSPTPCKYNEHGPGLLAQFPSVKRAVMFANHLNGRRILDKKLKIKVLGDTSGVENQITEEETNTLTKVIEDVIEGFKEAFISRLRSEIMKVPDVFSFKFVQCKLARCRGCTCHYYHGVQDRRRNYLTLKYSEKMCQHAQENNLCPEKDLCPFSHNYFERDFHPKKYKTITCLDWYEFQRCPKSEFCAKSHPTTPDSFFSESWKDVFVAGLDQTFLYFGGAVKLLYKVPDNEGGVPVLLITPQEDIALLASQMIKRLASTHRLVISVITQENQVPSGAHVLIGTPSALAHLIKTKGGEPLGALRVLIIDDITTQCTDPLYSDHLHFIVKCVFNESRDKNLICKVAVSATCHASEVEEARVFLDSELSLVNPHCIDSKLTPSANSAIVSDTSAPLSLGISSASDVQSEANLSDWESIYDTTISKKRKKNKNAMARYSSSSSSSDTDDSNESSTSLPSELRSTWKREERELIKELDEEYHVYLEVPEMHTKYEEKYESFLKSYKRKYDTTAESDHLSKMWMKYWKRSVDYIKVKDLKARKNELYYKFKEKAKEESKNSSTKPQSTNLPALSASAIMSAITEISSEPLGNFTIPDAFTLLDSLSDRVGGDVGASVKAVIIMARSVGVRTKECMDLLKKDCNISHLNNLFENLLSLSQVCDSTERDSCRKGIGWGLHLIKVAKEFKGGNIEKELSNQSTDSSKVRFDISLFAKQTFNQDIQTIYEALRRSLEFVYGSKPSEDLVNQTFNAVSAIHLNMAGSTPYFACSSYSTQPAQADWNVEQSSNQVSSRSLTPSVASSKTQGNTSYPSYSSSSTPASNKYFSNASYTSVPSSASNTGYISMTSDQEPSSMNLYPPRQQASYSSAPGSSRSASSLTDGGTLISTILSMAKKNIN